MADRDAPQPAPSVDGGELPQIDFSTFVVSLSHSALVHLGDATEADGSLDKDLPMAHQTIDILALLQDKTKGNLDGDEERLLAQVLYDLRMRFVEVARESSKLPTDRSGARRSSRQGGAAVLTSARRSAARRRVCYRRWMALRSRAVDVLLFGFALVLAACKRDPAAAAAAASAAALPGSVRSVAVAAGPAPLATPPLAIPPSGPTTPLSFAALVKKSDPGVVTVLADTRTSRGRAIMQGLGTGFVYDAGGYILTNNHVVEKANVIHVRLADDRRVPAKLVGRDPYTDVAVLKVEVQGLHALPLGDSNAIEIGDWVYAIGNPFGLSHTVSAGILSAKGRTQEVLEGLDRTGRGYFNFLQTDAAINQGNSGGPLLSLSGEVVGINTAIRANANSIGFAIPINMVKSLLPMLVKDGKVTRSALGVSVRVVSEEDVERLKRPDRKGALVGSVSPGGPADKAGLAENDVILELDSVPVADPNELRWLASIAGVGKQVTIKASRGTRIFDVKVTMGALPGNPDSDPEPPPSSP